MWYLGLKMFLSPESIRKNQNSMKIVNNFDMQQKHQYL